MTTPPTLHLNGTHPDDLAEGFIEAFRAVNDALDTLNKTAAPNGRDYYPQGDAALKQAIEEHVNRCSRLAGVADELLALAVHVQEAQPETGPLRSRPVLPKAKPLSANHTPGPWSTGSEYSNATDEILSADGRTIATCWTRRPNVPGATTRPCFKDDPELKTNARLLAAAPELLTALHGMVADWERVCGTIPKEHEAHAVIAKVHGGSQ